MARWDHGPTGRRDHRAATLVVGMDVHCYLGHGASGSSASMAPFVDGLERRGFAATAIDLPKRKAEDAVPAFHAVVPRAAGVVVGGHSYGGRVASLAAAEPGAPYAALVLFSYPLHPPGAPEKTAARIGPLAVDHLSGAPAVRRIGSVRPDRAVALDGPDPRRTVRARDVSAPRPRPQARARRRARPGGGLPGDRPAPDHLRAVLPATRGGGYPSGAGAVAPCRRTRSMCSPHRPGGRSHYCEPPPAAEARSPLAVAHDGPHRRRRSGERGHCGEGPRLVWPGSWPPSRASNPAAGTRPGTRRRARMASTRSCRRTGRPGPGSTSGTRRASRRPSNQEKVAAGKMTSLYRWLGSWRRVAYWWLTGSPAQDRLVAATRPATSTRSWTRYRKGSSRHRGRSTRRIIDERSAVDPTTTGRGASARHRGYAGGAVRYATSAGASATLTFTGRTRRLERPDRSDPRQGQDLHRRPATSRPSIFAVRSSIARATLYQRAGRPAPGRTRSRSWSSAPGADRWSRSTTSGRPSESRRLELSGPPCTSISTR